MNINYFNSMFFNSIIATWSATFLQWLGKCTDQSSHGEGYQQYPSFCHDGRENLRESTLISIALYSNIAIWNFSLENKACFTMFMAVALSRITCSLINRKTLQPHFPFPKKNMHVSIFFLNSCKELTIIMVLPCTNSIPNSGQLLWQTCNHICGASICFHVRNTDYISHTQKQNAFQQAAT